MKKYGVVAMLAAGVMSMIAPAQAQTDRHSVSMGYAQSKVKDFKNIRGVNVKYRYEWDSPVSIIGSFTYMQGSKQFHDREEFIDYSGNVWSDSAVRDIKEKYYSLSVGPAYRFNDYISLYGLLGATSNRASNNIVVKEEGVESYKSRNSISNVALMYGAGVQINLVNNIVIDLGYEGSSLDEGQRRLSINGFNLGIGYRF